MSSYMTPQTKNEAFIRQCKTTWDADRELQNEFEEDFDRFLYYQAAKDEGLVKQLGGKR